MNCIWTGIPDQRIDPPEYRGVADDSIDMRVLDQMDKIIDDEAADDLIYDLEYEWGDAIAKINLKKAMLNAYLVGNFESMNVFAKDYCREMEKSLRAKAERIAE